MKLASRFLAGRSGRWAGGYTRRMRVLLLEDDAALREGLADVLRRAGHEVSLLADGRQALSMLLVSEFDLAVVDLGLPGLDGMDLVRELRRRQRQLPVLIITARGGLQERIAGLDCGADDYLSKPFEVPEFEARVRALLRRHGAAQSGEVRVGPLRFTPGQPRVGTSNGSFTLPMGELAVLELLATQPGHLVGRDVMAARLSREGLTPSNSAIEVAVHRLRRRLAPHGVRIRALRGFGYVMEEQAGART